MRGNLNTSLKRSTRGRSMDRYDRLPPELRAWLSQAALPWSAVSALRLWEKLRRECAGDADLITQRLRQAEQRLLRRDAAKIWGEGYPSANL